MLKFEEFKNLREDMIDVVRHDFEENKDKEQIYCQYEERDLLEEKGEKYKIHNIILNFLACRGFSVVIKDNFFEKDVCIISQLDDGVACISFDKKIYKKILGNNYNENIVNLINYINIELFSSDPNRFREFVCFEAEDEEE